MSEEKLYAVKNDDGEYWDFNYAEFWTRGIPGCYATTIKKRVETVADEQGGHVVTFVEEHAKAVLTKAQAKIVERAHDLEYPANYISQCTFSYDDEKLIMSAYINGYTVADDKKYYVKVPHTKNVWYYNDSQEYLQTICPANKKLRGIFTEAEIDHYGLQDCERVEVTDDAEES